MEGGESGGGEVAAQAPAQGGQAQAPAAQGAEAQAPAAQGGAQAGGEGGSEFEF